MDVVGGVVGSRLVLRAVVVGALEGSTCSRASRVLDMLSLVMTDPRCHRRCGVGRFALPLGGNCSGSLYDEHWSVVVHTL